MCIRDRHIGHALNSTIQDILIRYKRMKDFDVLLYLIRMSWMVLLRAWPICNDPVTLGGGMTIEKTFAESVISDW